MDAGEVRQRVADQHREHARERDDGHREEQVDPEQAPELPDVVGAVTAVGVVSAAAAGGRCVIGVSGVRGGHRASGVRIRHDVLLDTPCVPPGAVRRLEPYTPEGYSCYARTRVTRCV